MYCTSEPDDDEAVGLETVKTHRLINKTREAPADWPDLSSPFPVNPEGQLKAHTIIILFDVVFFEPLASRIVDWCFRLHQLCCFYAEPV